MTSKYFDYPKKLDKIFDKLDNLNLSCIIVGGYVRDFYLNKSSKDIDIEVYGLDSITQLSMILKEFGEVNEVGKSFGVCKLTLIDLDLDFSMPRIDNKIALGHKGFIVQTKKYLDYKTAAFRRDFTINSIGYDTKKKQILDPYNGLIDLKNKLLKMVDKDSFIEDPLRVFRAVGMVARFDLKVEKHTHNLCSNMIKQKMLNELSDQRIYEELKKLFLKSKRPSKGLIFLKNINGLDFFTELKLEEKDWNFTLNAVDKLRDDFILSLTVLCYKLNNTNIASFISKITNNSKITKKIILFKNIANWMEDKNKTLLYSQMKNINIDTLKIFLKSISIKKELLLKLHIIKPKIHGKDLLKLGFAPSNEMGKLLQLSYEMQLLNYRSL